MLVERIIRKILDDSAGSALTGFLWLHLPRRGSRNARTDREALDRELDRDPDNEHVRRQLALQQGVDYNVAFLLHGSHSAILSVNTLDPGFRILNEHEADLMRQDLLEELFEEKYGEAEGDSESRFVRLRTGLAASEQMTRCTDSCSVSTISPAPFLAGTLA